ncbi:MAG: PQQ-dependent sugar dehydrogenase [Chloroflexota bacterium]|nr:PQQ-dependent sugar dehydrogenase [Chloroflexota bacterium]
MHLRRTSNFFRLFGFCLLVLAAGGLFAALASPGAVGAVLLPGENPAQNSGPHPASYPTVTTEPLPAGAHVDTLLTNMNKPIALAFDPDGRLFYTEKSGDVRLFQGGVLQSTPVIHFDADSSGERGLLGIAIDPNFRQNHYIYIYYTALNGQPGAATRNNVVRFIENNGVGSNPTTIFSSPQTAPNHNGGNIHFGPDGKLYISIGENAVPANSQDVTVPNGKMHRINADGSIPGDNPVFTQTGALPSLYAMGLRNSFDFTFDPVVQGRIFASENGPSCDDEMNRIVGGYNYGWRPNYGCDDLNPDPTYNTIRPLWFLGTGGAGPCCEAPVGIEVYSGSSVPTWHNDLFMCTNASGVLRHFTLSADRTQAITVARVQSVSCGMDVQTGPDGALWYIEGGGYATGILKRVVGTGGLLTPTATMPAGPTSTRATSTRTVVVPSATPVCGGTPCSPTPTHNPLTPSATATACTVQFTDVPAGSTFYSYVRCLACKGVLGGYACGGPGESCDGNNDPYFRPGSPISRGQIAKVVSNAAGYQEDAGPQIFEDIAPGSPFYTWVNRLANRGILSGYACGSAEEPCVAPGNMPYFRSGSNAGRGQLAKVVANAAGFDEPHSDQTFEDVQASSPFYLFVQRLASRGVMSGYACGGINPDTSQAEPCVAPGNRPYFRPGSNVSRGQAAKIVAGAFFPNCSASGSSTGVSIQNFMFTPGTITVTVGTTVQWTNTDLDYHTITSSTPLFNSGYVYRNQGYSYTFMTPGQYTYYCVPHPYMQGTINVTAP